MSKAGQRRTGEPCPACKGRNNLDKDEAKNAVSRYVDHYICNECGVHEATSGFFWRENAVHDKRTKLRIKPGA